MLPLPVLVLIVLAAHTLLVTLGGTATAVRIDQIQVSPDSVEVFDRVEVWVDVSATGYTNPFEPDPTRGGASLEATFESPSASNWTVFGFYTNGSSSSSSSSSSQSGSWRVRFAPPVSEPGTWLVSSVVFADPTGSAQVRAAGQFRVSGSGGGSGFVLLADGGGYYSMSGSGRPFFGIGHNTGWQTAVEAPAMAGVTPATPGAGGIPPTPELNASCSMSANGENLLSFWLSTPWVSSGDDEAAFRAPVEDAASGPGRYNEAPLEFVDQLLDRALLAGVYLLPTVWPHAALRSVYSPWGAANWPNNGYSLVKDPATGNPIPAYDFFRQFDESGAETEQWRLQQNFFRYLTARFSSSRALMGYVLVAEVDGTDGYTTNASCPVPPGALHNQTAAWVASATALLAKSDPYRGSRLPVTVSMTTNTDQLLAVSFCRLVGMSTCAVDSYTAVTSDMYVGQALATDDELMEAVAPRAARFHTEFGGNVQAGATQPRHFHNGVWAALASGTSVTPLLWTDGGQFPRFTDVPVGAQLQAHMRWLSQFVASLPYVGAPCCRSAQLAGGPPDPSPPFWAWGTWAVPYGFGFVLYSAGAVNATLTMPLGLPAGTVLSVNVYGTWSDIDMSQPLLSLEASGDGDGQVVVTIPAVLGEPDVAFTFCPLVSSETPPGCAGVPVVPVC